MTGIVSKIINGVVILWDDAEKDIDAAWAKIKAVLPASAQANLATVVADVKQSASDAISLVQTGVDDSAVVFSKALEASADAYMAAQSNGVALPLVPLVNKGIDDATALGTSIFNGWALSLKADLATPTTPTAPLA